MPTRPEQTLQELTMVFPWTFKGPCPRIFGYRDCSHLGKEFVGTRFQNVSGIDSPYFAVTRLPGESIAQMCERAAELRGDKTLTATTGETIVINDEDCDWTFTYTFNIGGE